jgi:RNA polymerase sigma-70 factor (ECF subfamily)
MGDSELVTAILGGDADRFSEVVDRFDRTVRGVIGARVRDPDSVEELTQQTFCRAFRNLAALREHGKLGAWLKRIAERAVADHERRRRTVELNPAVAAPAAPPERWIWDEVAALPAAQREVLRLRYREGRSYREIGRRLGVPPSTVRGRLYQARLALRRRLAPEEEST